jgi:hypothetical protein
MSAGILPELLAGAVLCLTERPQDRTIRAALVAGRGDIAQRHCVAKSIESNEFMTRKDLNKRPNSTSWLTLDGAAA